MARPPEGRARANPPATKTMTAEDRDKDSATHREKLFELLLRKKGIAVGAARAIPRRAGRGPSALSFAQERLWFLDQLEPGSPAYNLSGAIRLTGRLDAGALKEALGEIVRRHEVLRTTFAEVGGRPAQLVAESAEFRLPLTDLEGGDEAAREAEARRLAAEEARTPFDLSRGPLLRVRLLRLGGREHVLLLTMHHIISDGWSLGVLVRELTALYEAFALGRPSPLEELPIQYADFAVWQREWLTGDVLEEQLSYWKRQLAGAPALLALPTDRERPPVQTYRGATQSMELSRELAESLAELGRRRGATLFMVLLAAFQVLLHRWAEQDDIVIGTDIANRHRAETEGLIGFFVNMLVVRTRLDAGVTFEELLGRVREVMLGAYAHQDLPLEKLVEALRPERNPAYSPLFQVVFVLQNAPAPPLSLPDLNITPLHKQAEAVRFDLSLLMWETEGGMRGVWTYRTDLFDAQTVSRLMSRFANLLRAIAAEPGARVGSLDVRSEGERQELSSKKKALKAASFDKFRKMTPKAVAAAPRELVETCRLEDAEALPLLVRPKVKDFDAAAWARASRRFVDEELLRHGAILFRGFQGGDEGEFARFVRAVTPELMDYSEPTTPRKEVGGGLYTSTEHPADHHILLHNEMSYSRRWPLKIWFHCVRPAARGGETPIADSRRVYELLDARVRERFAERGGVMYVRNYGGGFGLSWQKVFSTESREEVERRCREAGVDFEWRGGDVLRTRQLAQAAARHPSTGEALWFNQAHVHHVLSLDPDLRELVLSVAEDEKFPLDLNAFYADGGEIEDSALEAIREAYRRATVSFAWQEGDILLLDNMRVAHGRAPFEGPRKVVVAMAEPFDAPFAAARQQTAAAGAESERR